MFYIIIIFIKDKKCNDSLPLFSEKIVPKNHWKKGTSVKSPYCILSNNPLLNLSKIQEKSPLLYGILMEKPCC